jgi:hypothetical protein
MDDTSKLIFEAIKKSTPISKKKKILKDIECLDKPCAIDNLKNQVKIKKDFKHKSPNKWTNADFAKYIEDSLKTRSLRFKDNTFLGGQQIAKLYDLFVAKISEAMNNNVLRDYIDWWMAYKTKSLDDSPVSIYDISKEFFVNDFIKYKNFNIKSDAENDVSQDVSLDISEDINFDKVYELGGLEFLLEHVGIVDSANYLKLKNKECVITISDCLKKMVKQSVLSILKITTSKKYQKEKLIDFLSIARPSLIYHGIKEYDKVQYKQFFQE